jgi:hypothetical protein
VNGKYQLDTPIEVIVRDSNQSEDWSVFEVASPLYYFLPDHWMPICQVHELPDLGAGSHDVRCSFYALYDKWATKFTSLV